MEIRTMQMQPVGSTDDLPQIPEPDGSYMLNQKFVIPIYKKSAGICTCYSSHTSKALHCPLLSERATQKPTLICIMTLECTFDWQRRTKVQTYPADTYCCFVFDFYSKLARFQTVKNKTSSKRLFLYVYFPLLYISLQRLCMENMAKIRIY